MPEWPPFLHGWVKQQLGNDADKGAEAVVDAVLEDKHGVLGLQGKSDELKAKIKKRLLCIDCGGHGVEVRTGRGAGPLRMCIRI